MRELVVLLTDFGLEDAYVGIMKGVLLARAPQAQIVDLCHGITPQNVRQGAFTLMTALPYFPRQALFVCVVDPGVGSRRDILWARSEQHQFLAPDNGILSWVERIRPILEIRKVYNRSLFLDNPSRTFHGRDIFAPVAAALACGERPELLGPRQRAMKRMGFPAPRRRQGRLRGEVLALDRFGNLITNLACSDLSPKMSFQVKGVDIGPLRTYYAQAPLGRPLALIGSSGFLEISLRQGNFAAKHSVSVGEAVYGF